MSDGREVFYLNALKHLKLKLYVLLGFNYLENKSLSLVACKNIFKDSMKIVYVQAI